VHDLAADGLAWVTGLELCRFSCGNPCEWLVVVTEVSPAWDLRPMDTFPASHRFAPITGPGRAGHAVLTQDPERAVQGAERLGSEGMERWTA